MQEQRRQIITFLVFVVVLIAILVALIITLVYLYKKRQNKHIRQLETIKNDYEKNILSAQLEMQEQTLQHISREIHDNINLGLTLAKLTLTTATPATVVQKAEEATGLITTAIESLTGLSRNISANQVEEEGLMAAVETELQKLNKTGEYETAFSCTGEPVFMDGKKELVIFRIVQEALNNIIKHARAGKIMLLMNYGEKNLDIKITDDGCGISNGSATATPAGRGAGLGNMKKRAAMAGGRCEIAPRPGGGTMVNITVPMEDPFNLPDQPVKQ